MQKSFFDLRDREPGLGFRHYLGAAAFVAWLVVAMAFGMAVV